MSTEFDLVSKFRDAKVKKDAIERQLAEAKAEYDGAESELIELMEANGATKTAEYEGLGHVTLLKPKLYASVVSDKASLLLSFLRENGRAEIIKETVNPATLSSYVGERISKGEQVPEFITYYLKQTARFYEVGK
jgi:hypothetical protein